MLRANVKFAMRNFRKSQRAVEASCQQMVASAHRSSHEHSRWSFRSRLATRREC